eukprot:gene19260-25115_t
MGQIEVPKDAIESLWLSYNITSENWSLNAKSLAAVIKGSDYINELEITDTDIEDLFIAFDTDCNEQIDALEMIVSLALVSGMDTIDKIQFVYNVYDFDGEGSLRFDELSLLIQSITTSCSKIFPHSPSFKSLSINQVETLAALVFADFKRENSQRISGTEIRRYFSGHPVAKNWLNFLSNINLTEHVVPSSSFFIKHPFAIDKELTAYPLVYRARKIYDPKIQIYQDTDEVIDVVNDAKEEVKSKELSWFADVDKMTPEDFTDLPAPKPEDSIVPVWIHGLNSSPGAVYSDKNEVIYSASRHIIRLSRNDENALSQNILSIHKKAIGNLTISSDRKVLATTDSDGNESLILLWDLQLGIVTWSISPGNNSVVSHVKFNGEANRLLVTYKQLEIIYISMYDLRTKSIVFTTPFNKAVVNCIEFARSSSIFAIGSDTGISFFVNEDEVAAVNGFEVYESRDPLYQRQGHQTIGLSCTALSSFALLDELVTGHPNGQILLWRGRCCSQTVQAHAKLSTVLQLHTSNVKSKDALLISLGSDGKIVILKAVNMTAAAVGARTIPTSTRAIEIDRIINLHVHNIPPQSLKTIDIASDLSKCLLTTDGFVFELSCTGEPITEVVETITKPTNEDEESQEVKENDPDEEPLVKLGEILNKGPIVQAIPSGSSITASIGLPTGNEANAEFITCDNSGTISLWSVNNLEDSNIGANKLIQSFVIDSCISSAAVTTSNLFLALDGSINSSRLGVIQIYKLSDLKLIASLTESKDTKAISLKVNNEGTQLITASSDDMIRIYSLNESIWSRSSSFKSNGAVVASDLSSDGQNLRVQLSSGRLIIYDLVNQVGKEVKDQEILRSISFLSSDCLFQWDLKGIFTDSLDIKDITTSSRSNNLLVVGFKNSQVNIYKTPQHIYQPKSDKSLILSPCHLSAISSVFFIDNGSRLITVGSSDRLVVIWKISINSDDLDPLPEEKSGEDEEQEDQEEDDDNDDESSNQMLFIKDSGPDEDLLDGPEVFSHETVRKLSTIREEAVKSFASSFELNLSGIKNNSLASPIDKIQAPADDLVLAWVHGYSVRRARQSVKYTYDGSVVYSAGPIGVVYDKTLHVQKHCLGHSDEITCLDVHPLSGLCVSGQSSERDVMAFVWESWSGKILQRLSFGQVNGLSTVLFDQSGSLVFAACQDIDHSIKIIDWKSNIELSSVKTGSLKISSISVSNINSDNYKIRLLETGINHFGIVEINKSNYSTKLTGLYGPEQLNHPHIFTSISIPSPVVNDPSELDGRNEFLVGLSNGSLGTILYNERKISNYVPALKGPVNAMAVIPSLSNSPEEILKYRIVIAGVNGFIKILDSDLQELKVYNLYVPPKEIGRFDHGLHPTGRAKGFLSVAVDRFNRKILYSTAGGELGEIELETGFNVNNGPIVESHCRYSLRTLASHPIRQECITAGDDKVLRVWNIDSHKSINQIDLPAAATSLTYSPNGQLIVAGLGKLDNEIPSNVKTFGVAIISYLQGDLRIVHVATDAEDDVVSTVFTPDGSKLFAGSLDKHIYAYNALDNFRLMKKISSHNQPIASLDMSIDGKIFVSYGSIDEIFLWETSTNSSAYTEEAYKAAVDETKWFEKQSKIGKATVGIYEPFTYTSEITAISVSKNNGLISVGSSYGPIKLLIYPSSNLFCPYKEYHGHSSGGVSQVRFSFNSEYVFSVGKSDRLLLTWKVKTSESLRSYDIIDKPNENVKLNQEESLGDFDSSFLIKTVNFLKRSISNHPDAMEGSHNPDLRLFTNLKQIVGIGTNNFYLPMHLSQRSDDSPPITANHFNLPSANYCGLGDIVTGFGKLACVISRDKVHYQSIQLSESVPIHLSTFTIIATVVSNHRKYIAIAGVSNGSSKIVIVFASSYKLHSVLCDQLDGSVVSVTFSNDDKNIAVLHEKSDNNGKYLTVYRSFSGDWLDSVVLLSESYVTARLINIVKYLPQISLISPTLNTSMTTPRPKTAEKLSRTKASDDSIVFDLVAAGTDILMFIKLNADRNIYIKSIEYPGTITAVSTIFHSSITVTGDDKGIVTVWNYSNFQEQLLAHDSCVSSILSYHNSDVINPVDSSSFVSTSKHLKSSKSTIVTNSSRVAQRTTNISKYQRGLITASSDFIRLYGIEEDDSRNIRLFVKKQIKLSTILNLPGDYSTDRAATPVALKKASQLLVQIPFVTSLSVDSKATKLLVSTSTSKLVEVTVDSESSYDIISGEFRAVEHLLRHPENVDIIVTITSDNSINIWQCSGNIRSRIGELSISHKITFASFVSINKIVVGLKDTDTNGISGSIVFVELVDANTGYEALVHNGLSTITHVKSYEKANILMSISHRIHNIGKGGILDIKYSPNKLTLAASSEDGYVYIFSREAASIEHLNDRLFKISGALRVHISGVSSVQSIDFSTSGQYLRTFSPCFTNDKNVVINYFDLNNKDITEDAASPTAAVGSVKSMTSPGGKHKITIPSAGSRVVDPLLLEVIRDTIKWDSVSSVATAELRGLYNDSVRDGLVELVNYDISPNSKIVVAAYSDGNVLIYGYPTTKGQLPLLTISAHSFGPVRVVFLGNSTNTIATCGVRDGTIMIWDVYSV